MILLMFAIQVAPVPALQPEPESEVLVIGRRLEEWRSKLTSEKGRLTCVTKRSTGDAEIDAIGCTAMTDCFPKAQPAFEATRAKGLARDERKRLMTVAEQAMIACVTPRRAELVRELAIRRKAQSAVSGVTQ
ncbi:hypothetical protein KV697_17230 [Sphingomonas sanguinis]|uniref:hypothetical protein n=1 Tax=Sphingomonas sanguinis TaxID=33051 RepID=UPI001C58DD0C|nr:hypothetical protein [Sphingomonas sanguinis]QXT35452.1 hypothetical protein KV697_17230 [Sphingomonas sanguinis]